MQCLLLRGSRVLSEQGITGNFLSKIAFYTAEYLPFINIVGKEQGIITEMASVGKKFYFLIFDVLAVNVENCYIRDLRWVLPSNIKVSWHWQATRQQKPWVRRPHIATAATNHVFIQNL